MIFKIYFLRLEKHNPSPVRLQINQLYTFMQRIILYCENQMEGINILCGRNWFLLLKQCNLKC